MSFLLGSGFAKVVFLSVSVAFFMICVAGIYAFKTIRDEFPIHEPNVGDE